MIPREQFDAYNRAVAILSDGASKQIESQIWAWLQTEEGKAASVAECREYAKAVMSGVMQRYDEAAASLAAQWYGRQAEDNHLKLASAITSTVYDPKRVDETARYQANKLLKGDLRGFAKYCGELGRNDVLRSLNETIMDNVGRDKDKGARFARIPTGFETCTFCLMLASRGAVYRTRKSAGEFKHSHRGCDCKVVPSFDPDPDAEVVEGVKPQELYGRYKQFKEIESESNLTVAQKESLKRSIAREPTGKNPDWHELRNRRTVDMDYVRSKTCRAVLRKAFGETPPKNSHEDVLRMLSHRSGTDLEDLYAYDATEGKRIGSVTTSTTPKEVRAPDEMTAAIAKAVALGHDVVMLHNHPDSMPPSDSDLLSLMTTKAKYGIITCHDGSVYRYELEDDKYDGYNKEDFKRVCSLAFRGFSNRIKSGKSESAAFAAMRNDWGIKIEHLF